MWAIKVDSLTNNNYNVGIKPIAAIVDSGTSVLAVHPTILENWRIPQLRGAECPKSLEDWPTLGINIDGLYFSLEPKDYIIKIADNCIMGISAVPGGMENIPMILGDTFMRKYYCHFDYENKRIGFARSVQHNGKIDPFELPETAYEQHPDYDAPTEHDYGYYKSDN